MVAVNWQFQNFTQKDFPKAFYNTVETLVDLNTVMKLAVVYQIIFYKEMGADFCHVLQQHKTIERHCEFPSLGFHTHVAENHRFRRCTLYVTADWSLWNQIESHFESGIETDYTTGNLRLNLSQYQKRVPYSVGCNLQRYNSM